MKIAFVLIAVLIGVWLFRASRRAPRDRQESKRATPSDPQSPSVPQLDMVRCEHCDLHLPKADAVTGRRGIYCSLEHRQRAES